MGDEETRTMDQERSDYESVTMDAPEVAEPQEPADGQGASDDNADEDKENDSEGAASSDSSGAEDGDSDADKDADDKSKQSPPDKEPKKKNRFQEKIDELTKTARTAERLAADEKARADAAEAKLNNQAQGAGRKAQGEEDEKGRPKPENFEDYDAFMDALADWKVEQKLKAMEGEREEARQREAAEKDVREFKGKLDRFAEDHADFKALVVDNKTLPLTEAMFNAVRDSEHAPEILYFMGLNPDEAKRISRLPSSMAIAREIGKLEDKAQSGSLLKKKQTNAPDPIKPLDGSGGTIDKDPSEMSNEEYRRWRRTGKKG